MTQKDNQMECIFRSFKPFKICHSVFDLFYVQLTVTVRDPSFKVALYKWL